MQNKIGTLWLIGAGNMGGALLSRWAGSGVADRIVVIDPGAPDVPDGVALVADFAAVGDAVPDLVVLAVKPHLAGDALAELPEAVRGAAALVSVLAGTTISSLSERVPGMTVIRAMPNTPVAVGKGATGLFGSNLEAELRSRLEALFAPTGVVVWLEEEAQFDALTALSGSGPAYVFRMTEALAAAGEAAGLPEDLARTLAEATVSGAGALMESDERSAADLRRAVTSPNGTTQAGLEALDEDPGLPALVRNAVRAAAARSRELASET
ncbi:MAG: pyrroline-5-carboxylate reductase [Pacificimonas sp.]|jgi:pyrroline-5-carboxylate reductase|nr:pyrroline-5-carboxylate reductase [Pacificimonas sp.]